VTIDGKKAEKSSMVLKKEEVITIHFPENKAFTFKPCAQEVGASILYEHEHFLIVYKPPFLNVHTPREGYKELCLVDWLVAKMPTLINIGSSDDRPGIVHRLDKDTSGILIVAKNNYAHAVLASLFHDRKVNKTYYALVQGHPPAQGTIPYSIGRDASNWQKRTHFPVGHAAARDALTHYKVLEYVSDSALLEVKPVTGRTHQIRVHCAAIGHPIIGDILYGSSSKEIKRQALHAKSIAFAFEGTEYLFEAELPEDFANVLNSLRNMKQK
jgi:23S rRNA pseudouridine1911/1915/1917 synthase